ncbi:peptidoglycan-binding protein [Streptomyces hoynatensis]|uniref:Peptidoglycan-binding protein n=1 Tax=Streptomyces hoynatensis TaxID=1141874 RepID=A0A3A9ZHE9_9ACTN|nr:peptidoglycan-binding protein [Streptomyces hoynatensis]RKN46696.1 peptidoglycan-binding protein [Streptomyces hoynatensis]
MPEIQPQGVDAGAVAAVAARLRRALAAEGTVVSVPALVTGYDAEALGFAGAGPATAEQARAAAEFAELVNRVPLAAPVWSRAGTEHLWDVYRDVLGAELAATTLSAEEQGRYSAALSLLYRFAQGRRVPSRVYLDYQSTRHAALAAQAALAAGEGTDREPALRQARDAALQRWRVEGRRAEVEAALLDLDTLGDKDPGQVWAGYRTQFDPGPGSADWATGLDGSRYAPTGFAPAGILDQPWSQLSIDAAELPETAARIESLSFEYALVDVVRPWLDPAMFRSRAWRFPAGAQPLSDGADPPSGRCPAYVESVVLVRSLRVVCAPSPAGGGQGPGGGVEPGGGEGPGAGGQERPTGLGFLDPAFATLVLRAAPEEGHAPAPDVLAEGVRRWQRVVGAHEFAAAEAPEPVPPEPTPAAPADRAVSTTPPSTVLLAAFVLRLLPACPNPDPALVWEGEQPLVRLANVQFGKTNEEVRTVQRALLARGRHLPTGATGHFGTATRAAYAAEQRAQGFGGSDADGAPGCRSLTTLGEEAGFRVLC